MLLFALLCSFSICSLIRWRFLRRLGVERGFRFVLMPNLGLLIIQGVVAGITRGPIGDPYALGEILGILAWIDIAMVTSKGKKGSE